YLGDGPGVTAAYYFSLAPAAALAILLPYFSPDFNDLFMIQATVLAGLFVAAGLSLWPVLRHNHTTPGLRLMLIAIFLLAVDFLHDVPVFGARKGLWGITVPSSYLQYTPVFDVLLEILLGFGMMMVLLETVRREVEATNRQLTQTRDKLELMASMDPLTEALNRHAFHSLLSRDAGGEGQTHGCVAVIDIDNLKPINDQFGHSVGDKAIRSVARAVRSLIRADDMVFRWGGDEFLVLLFRLPEAEAARRMDSLNDILRENSQRWTGSPITITVSSGVSGFDSLPELREAIERADQAMYESRQQRGRPTRSRSHPLTTPLRETTGFQDASLSM
ncbi:MAG TPA: GGDEF domain-containing protein, partial [Pyrinomonadaceae bacterium]|nr:GGDEF domain-containing protein [Pyrinomonadaceae bacterium]